MNARMIMTSGTVSYAPPVWPESPFAPARAVKKTIASRQSWMLCFNTAFCSSVSDVLLGFSLSGLRAERSIGNFSVAIGSQNIAGAGGGGKRFGAVCFLLPREPIPESDEIRLQFYVE